MKAQVKQDRHVITFDDRLRDAICRHRSLSQTERIELYNDVIRICLSHVQECTDSIVMSQLLALHDLYGFGKHRLGRLRDETQKIADEAVRIYGVGVPFALRDKLHEIGVDYKL